jgi:group I intron endonuclease
MKTASIIYKATNKITGLSYIGYTSCGLKHRISEHKSDSKRSDTHFYRAAKKYGWESFEWSILYQSFDNKHCLSIMEPHFITEYDTYNNGYNTTTGGDGLGSDVMRNLWLQQNSPYRTESYSRKQSDTIKKLHSSSNSPYKSESYIEKQKSVHIERYGKEFIAISPEGVTYTVKGLKEFCRLHNLTPQCAGKVLNGKSPSHKGWIFSKIF